MRLVTDNPPAAGFKPEKSVARSGVTAGHPPQCTGGRTGHDHAPSIATRMWREFGRTSTRLWGLRA